MSYENFMCNKDFHPSNIRNLKKMYEAEQRQKQEDRRQEELRQQYIKEQEIYKSKELIGKANPLNFMYEPPPGFAKDGKGAVSGDSKQPEGEGETKLKFDWQRTGRTAPREEYAKDMELRDKPFGIEVRNVKCIKCGKWGHINTDRVCPLYGKAKPIVEGESAPPVPAPLPDLDTMEDGLIFKQCVRDRIVDDRADNQQILLSDDEETQIGDLLSGLSKRERKRVLRKLAKSEGNGGRDGDGVGREPAGRRGEGEKKKKRKHGRKKKKRLKKERGSSGRRKRERSSSESESESESEDEEEERERKRKQKTVKQHRKKAERRERWSDESSNSSSQSESEDDGHRKRKRKIKQKKGPSESDDLADSEIDRERRPKHRSREESGRHHDGRRSSGHSRDRDRSVERQRSRDGGSRVKESSHYDRGRTRYDRGHKHYYHSSDDDHSRRKR